MSGKTAVWNGFLHFHVYRNDERIEAALSFYASVSESVNS